MPRLSSSFVAIPLALAALGGFACAREASSDTGAPSGEEAPLRGAASDSDFARSWTLVATVRAEVIAELVFRENELVRVDYETPDRELRVAFQKKLDSVLEEAKRAGLSIKFHGPAEDGDHGPLLGASPKPGQPRFTQAMKEHLHEGTFTISVK